MGTPLALALPNQRNHRPNQSHCDNHYGCAALKAMSFVLQAQNAQMHRFTIRFSWYRISDCSLSTLCGQYVPCMTVWTFFSSASLQHLCTGSTGKSLEIVKFPHSTFLGTARPHAKCWGDTVGWLLHWPLSTITSYSIHPELLRYRTYPPNTY